MIVVGGGGVSSPSSGRACQDRPASSILIPPEVGELRVSLQAGWARQSQVTAVTVGPALPEHVIMILRVIISLHTIMILLFLTIHSVQPAQYFSTVPEYTEVNPGSVAELRCVVSDKAALSQCVWQVRKW